MTPDTSDNIDLENLIPLQEVPNHLPKPGGRKIHVSQPYRWAKKGLGGAKLRTVKVGATMYTSKAWIWEFLNRDNAARRPNLTPRRRERELDRAERELAAQGL
jgi:hypothetical protein